MLTLELKNKSLVNSLKKKFPIEYKTVSIMDYTNFMKKTKPRTSKEMQSGTLTAVFDLNIIGGLVRTN